MMCTGMLLCISHMYVNALLMLSV